MQFPRRFRLASLFAIVTVSALSIAAHNYFSASGRYKRNGDVETFCLLLATRIEAGDTLAEVSSILGPGTQTDGSYTETMTSVMFGARFDSVSRWPDGIEDNDLFVLYRADPKPTYELQFRDGILVNHDPSWYEGPNVMVTALR
ncbi:hypothetical protein CA13_00330 [Planctomycetes bacterium CA13]|uniref:Uncharacterized protein n=1 Tax=Novipirellula herctigrandis TaxID=2527986 RepID=A0A5C5YVU0_9BACT|nr:hypothetical protein CA13_00330 [Planctomycetes bacterium CA13]